MVGRPRGSVIRENVKKLLREKGAMTGYSLYKEYRTRFALCSQRSIYYHLTKGVDFGEISIQKVQEEKGDFSWGKSSMRIYYTIAD
ncbi:MAG: hypothetical protein ACI8Y7_000344 [Candidatus Woesearchaeota archaeon]|jgi:hypothetical protein